MGHNLLIIGAGIYGVVASEVASAMGCFGKIAFVDDYRDAAPNGAKALGKVSDLMALSREFGHAIVAIGDSNVRLSLIRRIEEETSLHLVTLVSPCAFVAPSAQLGRGCIIEPMAVIHTGCILETGCIVSAGAVVNHVSLCREGVHIDCNATVVGNIVVPARIKVSAGVVFQGKVAKVENSLPAAKNGDPHPPTPVDGLDYEFEDGM